jgi:outer membrane protein assembly factor BamB
LKKRILFIVVVAATMLLGQAAGVAQMELEWTINLTEYYPGKVFGAGCRSFATVYDVDKDGTNEILFGSRRGDSRRFWCFEPGPKLEWVYPPITEDGLPHDPFTKATIEDVNNDGTNEIIFQGRSGYIYVLNPDGTDLWKWKHPKQGDFADSIMLECTQCIDVDGDGIMEFFGSDNGGFTFRINQEQMIAGEGFAWQSAQAGKSNEGNPTIADFDKDGVYEVVIGSNDQYVYCYDGNTGKEEWRFDTGAWMDEVSIIVADINNDGDYEILAYNDPEVSAVICLSFYGMELWRWTAPPGTNFRVGQAIADVDEDGILDMVLSTDTGHYCIEIGGATDTIPPKLKWEINCTKWGQEGKIPAGAAGNMRSPYQLVIDIDGDDKLEAILISNGPNVTIPIVVDAATGELEAYYYNEHIKGRYGCVGVWSGDVDGDGESEYIFAAEGNTHPESQRYCLTLHGKWPAKAPWPEMFHSALPESDQLAADWLTLKAKGSNSVFFPIVPVPEFALGGVLALLGLLARRR